MAALPCFRSWLLGDLRHKTQRMLGLARGGERLSNRRGQAKIQFSGLMINKTTIPQMAPALFLLPFLSSSSYSSSWPASSLSPFSSSSSLANGLLQLSSWSVQQDCLWTSMNTDIVTWGEKVCRRQNFEFHPCYKVHTEWLCTQTHHDVYLVHPQTGMMSFPLHLDCVFQRHAHKHSCRMTATWCFNNPFSLFHMWWPANKLSCCALLLVIQH